MGILYPYQIEYANRKDNFSITNKSRRIGFSTVIAYTSVKRCLFDNIDQLLCSSSQRQSNLLMSFVELLLDRYYRKKGVKLLKDTQTQKVFQNRKSIYCFPSKPETVRGFGGDVRLDEFSLHKDDKRIYESLLPSISTNKKYQISISSTPLGDLNMFHLIYTDRKQYPDFKPFEVNCYEAIKQGCKLNVEMIQRNMDEDSFRQEYLCEFLSDADSYFPFELLKKCIDDYSNPKGKSYQGSDIGRTKDRFCTSGVTVDNDIHYLVKLETLLNKDFDTMKTYIEQQKQELNSVKVLIDKGAIGYQLAEELEKKYPGVCEGVFTNQTDFMADVVTFTKKLMEQGKFKMSEELFGAETIRQVMNDFHKIKKVISITNKVTFQIERDTTGHGDRAIAVMLANYGVKNPEATPRVRIL